jgi:3-hydroxybutyryl-CoA dehydratase
MQGMYFEEFQVGMEWVTAARTVTETDVVNFAGMSGDWNPLHSDAEFAAKSMFGQRLAHGTLGLVLATGLTARLGFIDGTAIAARGIEEWKFKKPLFIGDTVFARVRVTKTEPVPRLGGGMVTLWLTLVNQRGEEVQAGCIAIGLKSQESAGQSR